jgi:hypothetical protein
MLRPIGLKKAATALIAGMALSAATIGAAQADGWGHHHGHGGWGGGGWGRGGAVYVGPGYYAPGYYYAPPPPPVYYAPPPPVYYAPPPPPVYYAPAPAVSLQFRL